MDATQIARYVLAALEEVAEVTEEEIKSVCGGNSSFDDVIDEMIGCGYVESTIVKVYGRFLPALRLPKPTGLRIAA